MDHPGQVRFIGTTGFGPAGKVWIGVEMADPIGNCDGSIDGVRYFSAAPDRALFVEPEGLKVLPPCLPPPAQSLARDGGCVVPASRYALPPQPTLAAPARQPSRRRRIQQEIPPEARRKPRRRRPANPPPATTSDDDTLPPELMSILEEASAIGASPKHTDQLIGAVLHYLRDDDGDEAGGTVNGGSGLPPQVHRRRRRAPQPEPHPSPVAAPAKLDLLSPTEVSDHDEVQSKVRHTTARREQCQRQPRHRRRRRKAPSPAPALPSLAELASAPAPLSPDFGLSPHASRSYSHEPGTPGSPARVQPGSSFDVESDASLLEPVRRMETMLTSIQQLLAKTDDEVAAEAAAEATVGEPSGPRPWPRAPKVIYPARQPKHPRALEEVRRMEAMNDKILEAELIAKTAQERQIASVMEPFAVTYAIDAVIEVGKLWTFHEIQLGLEPTSLTLAVVAEPMWALASLTVSNTNHEPTMASAEWRLSPVVSGSSLAFTDCSGTFFVGVARHRPLPGEDVALPVTIHIDVGGYVAPADDLTLQWRVARADDINLARVDAYHYLESSIADYHVDAIEPHLGRTALHFAAEAGALELAQWLLSRQADANARDRYGNTPLFAAARGAQHNPAGALQMVELLLDSGGVVYARNLRGQSPLHIAAATERSGAIAALLLARRADPGARDADGQTPVDVGRDAGHGRVVRLFDESDSSPPPEPDSPVGSRLLSPSLRSQPSTSLAAVSISDVSASCNSSVISGDGGEYGSEYGAPSTPRRINPMSHAPSRDLASYVITPSKASNRNSGYSSDSSDSSNSSSSSSPSSNSSSSDSPSSPAMTPVPADPAATPEPALDSGSASSETEASALGLEAGDGIM
ncbi:ankyrin [Thecamonas trahens ATCC 50062]|uniref:Ankyrin n=1 Tax=Thecamonas trahens ATCC 50062 TaxID=461836 RepID=A0A0L0D232_THETB|nr:ankyrin [Thecamonas trahens ATCC 50062]KNC46175.1 ankyrin [Thecamonas trahens ATCC 50062]|eukprot:XP_013763150.1 ankyrin [Thecamonas trahens ATCC 50062]